MGFFGKMFDAAMTGRRAATEVDNIAAEIVGLNFGDDGSYSGIQGSQIARACWLSIFLGIDPNSKKTPQRGFDEETTGAVLGACPMLKKFADSNDGFRSQFVGVVNFTHPWSVPLMDNAEIPVEDMTRRLKWLSAKTAMMQEAVGEGHEMLRVLRKYTR